MVAATEFYGLKIQVKSVFVEKQKWKVKIKQNITLASKTLKGST